MLTVGLIYNLKKNDSIEPDRYLEFDDPATIEAVKKAIEKHHKVIPIEADSAVFNNLLRYKEEIDIAFNVAEGHKGSGREAFVPSLLEELGIPYTGSDPSTLVLCLDKQRTKEILSFYDIPCPAFRVFEDIPELTEKAISPLEFPLIVKPLWEGSSKGIKNSSLVINFKDCQNEIARIVQNYKQPALVEEFIPGREFTIGILGNDDEAFVLPIVEINFSGLPKGAVPIYSYEAKWIWDVPEKPLNIFHCPAELDALLEKKIKDTALSAYKVLRCKDWCRVDLRLDKTGKPYILELNPIPGILPDPSCNSCLPKAVYSLGWNYERLINTVLEIACKRYDISYETESRNSSI
jgi:D-alanine-D-alanine ligase